MFDHDKRLGMTDASVLAARAAAQPRAVSTTFTVPDQETALTFIVSRITETVRHSEEYGDLQFFAHEHRKLFFRDGKLLPEAELRFRVQQTVQKVYNHPFFTGMKKRPGARLLDAKGRMGAFVASLFWKIPIHLALRDDELLRAFAAFAPAHLR